MARLHRGWRRARRHVLSGANQEHGIVSRPGAPDAGIATRFPVGTLLRILPNHACATGAQFPEYQRWPPRPTAGLAAFLWMVTACKRTNPGA